MAFPSMANIPPSYYHASAAIPIANHGDFFNTHSPFHSKHPNDGGGLFRELFHKVLLKQIL
jgi:hypothetical protein